MKRRVLITLLTLTMTAAMITGCGNKPVDSLADESTVESTVEATDETTVEPAESEPENEPSTQPETEEETPAEGSTEDPSEETTPETKTAQDESQPEEKPQAETEPKTEIEPETTPVADTPVVAPDPAVQAPAYNVTTMSATMYVKNSVNLRQGPGTDYSKVGSLNKGDQVNVTGQADNGWYQLDSGAFVSNKYLTNDAPAAATVPVATVPGATDVTADPMTTLPITIPNQTVSTGADFLNYLNQQRSAAGLGTLRWDDGMAAVAQRRAQEITKGLDHSGNAEQYGEVIQQAISGSATEWYNNWYNSEAHRTSMFGKNYTRAGVGVYAVGNNYFVVCNFQGDEITTEQLIEQFNPDNMVQIDDNTYIGKDDYDTMINAGIDPGAQPDEEANKQMDEQKKLAEEGFIEVPSLN